MDRKSLCVQTCYRADAFKFSRAVIGIQCCTFAPVLKPLALMDCSPYIITWLDVFKSSGQLQLTHNLSVYTCWQLARKRLLCMAFLSESVCITLAQTAIFPNKNS